MHHCACQTQTLLHAAGETFDIGIFFVGKVGEVENQVNQPRAVALWNLVRCGEKVEVLPDLELIVDAECVRHVPNPGPDGIRVFHHINAIHKCRTCGRLEQGCQNLDGGCLASAVWTDKAKDFTRAKRKREVVHRRQLVVALGDISEVNT